jgi:hypothetical protein
MVSWTHLRPRAKALRSSSRRWHEPLGHGRLRSGPLRSIRETRGGNCRATSDGKSGAGGEHRWSAGGDGLVRVDGSAVDRDQDEVVVHELLIARSFGGRWPTVTGNTTSSRARALDVSRTAAIATHHGEAHRLDSSRQAALCQPCASRLLLRRCSRAAESGSPHPSSGEMRCLFSTCRCFIPIG